MAAIPSESVSTGGTIGQEYPEQVVRSGSRQTAWAQRTNCIAAIIGNTHMAQLDIGILQPDALP